jgi:glycosyltransferase involved in cell wall biosynthesis
MLISNTMNILLINHYAGSPKYGMEYRPYYLAREWVKNGHNVRIVAASESHVRHESPVLNQKVNFENIDSIEYVWLKTPSYKGNGLKRVLNMLSFITSLFLQQKYFLKNFNPDVVIASSTYPLDIYPAKQIAKKFHVKLVFEIHDLWPLSPIELGNISPYHPFMLVLQHAENFYCRHADRIVSILPNVKEHLLKHGMTLDKLTCVPNGIVIDDWNKKLPLSTKELEMIMNIKNKFNILVGYIGNHGIANGLNHLIQAAELSKNKNIAYILVGHGSEKEYLQQYTKTLNLENVFFIPSIEKKKVPSVLELLDILYIGLKKQPLFRFGVSPNKLFDYMMAGKPIIHAIDAGNDLVKESGCGISCEAENSEALFEAVIQLQNMPTKQRKIMGEKGKKYVMQHHDYQILAQKFINAIE